MENTSTPPQEPARAGFEQLGCPGWAHAAAAELDRISGRRAAPSGGLTPGGTAGRRTGDGRPVNKQVAAQLYVSVYTVEAHLSQAYAKLGIGSRTQLARALPPGVRSGLPGRAVKDPRFPGFAPGRPRLP